MQVAVIFIVIVLLIMVALLQTNIFTNVFSTVGGTEEDFVNYMNLVKEGKQHITTNKYIKVNSVITEILCANGTCPIF